MPLKLTVNNVAKTVDVPPDTPLLWVLRDVLDLKGAKFWLRNRRVRRLHRAVGRKGRALLHDARGQRGRRGHHHHRRACALGRSPPRAGSLGGCRRAAMRLLPARPDYGGRGAAEQNAASH